MSYNALLLTTYGGCKKISLDFNNYEQMGEMVNASLIKIVITIMTMNHSNKLGFTVVGFCNSEPDEVNDERNEVMEQFSGSKNIYGNVVLCGFNNVYTPLKEYQLDVLMDYLRSKY